MTAWTRLSAREQRGHLAPDADEAELRLLDAYDATFGRLLDAEQSP